MRILPEVQDPTLWYDHRPTDSILPSTKGPVGDPLHKALFLFLSRCRAVQLPIVTCPMELQVSKERGVAQEANGGTTSKLL